MSCIEFPTSFQTIYSINYVRDEMPAWDNHAPVAFIFSQRSAFWVYTFTQNAFRKLKILNCASYAF